MRSASKNTTGYVGSSARAVTLVGHGSRLDSAGRVTEVTAHLVTRRPLDQGLFQGQRCGIDRFSRHRAVAEPLKQRGGNGRQCCWLGFRLARQVHDNRYLLPNWPSNPPESQWHDTDCRENILRSIVLQRLPGTARNVVERVFCAHSRLRPNPYPSARFRPRPRIPWPILSPCGPDMTTGIGHRGITMGHVVARVRPVLPYRPGSAPHSPPDWNIDHEL